MTKKCILIRSNLDVNEPKPLSCLGIEPTSTKSTSSCHDSVLPLSCLSKSSSSCHDSVLFYPDKEVSHEVSPKDSPLLYPQETFESTIKLHPLFSFSPKAPPSVKTTDRKPITLHDDTITLEVFAFEFIPF